MLRQSVHGLLHRKEVPMVEGISDFLFGALAPSEKLEMEKSRRRRRPRFLPSSPAPVLIKYRHALRRKTIPGLTYMFLDRYTSSTSPDRHPQSTAGTTDRLGERLRYGNCSGWGLNKKSHLLRA